MSVNYGGRKRQTGGTHFRPSGCVGVLVICTFEETLTSYEMMCRADYVRRNERQDIEDVWLAEDRDRWRALVSTVMNIRVT